MFSPSARSQIPPFLVMDVMEAADRAEQSGHRVLHLEVGQPGTPAPQLVRAAAHRALDEQQLGYTLAGGIRPLREKIAGNYLSTYGVRVDPESIVITSGASGAFVLAFTAAFAAGARVAHTVPGYPCYPNILEALDLVPVPLRVGLDSGYQLTREQLAQVGPSLDGLILASPANPTGSMLSPEALRSLLSECRERKIFTIVDEIYHGLVFNGAAPATAAEFSESTIVIGSFSKYHSMTGWRLGWMVVPPSFRRTAEILSQNLAICAPAISQVAALAAFEASEELEGHVERYRRNRDALLLALRNAGVKKMAPADGAFYIYADLSDFTEDSQQLCAQMLDDIQVAATSGVDFDRQQGNRMVRFSYCRSEEDVREAAERLEAYLSKKRLRSL